MRECNLTPKERSPFSFIWCPFNWCLTWRSISWNFCQFFPTCCGLEGNLWLYPNQWTGVKGPCSTGYPSFSKMSGAICGCLYLLVGFRQEAPLVRPNFSRVFLSLYMRFPNTQIQICLFFFIICGTLHHTPVERNKPFFQFQHCLQIQKELKVSLQSE